MDHTAHGSHTQHMDHRHEQKSDTTPRSLSQNHKIQHANGEMGEILPNHCRETFLTQNPDTKENNSSDEFYNILNVKKKHFCLEKKTIMSSIRQRKINKLEKTTLQTKTQFPQ